MKSEYSHSSNSHAIKAFYINTLDYNIYKKYSTFVFNKTWQQKYDQLQLTSIKMHLWQHKYI